MKGNRMKTIRAGRGSESGFTLLEVLTAIFVLTFGLLGITAMMQIGGYRVWQATRRDRASYLAEQAFSELAVRDTVPKLQALHARLGNNAFQNRSMVVYDPEGMRHEVRVAGAGVGADVGRFAIRLGGENAVSSYFGVLKSDGLWRDMNEADLLLPEVVRFADPIWTSPTTSRDDLVWNSDNRERRPVAQYWLADGSMVPALDASENFIPAALTPAYSGNWSWMATIQPLGRRQTDSLQWMYDASACEISVAVYESRAFGNEVGFVVESGVDGMLQKKLMVRRLPAYATVSPSRSILQSGHWVALIGPPVGVYDQMGNLLSATGVGDKCVVWMQVVSARMQPNDPDLYEVQLSGPDLIQPSKLGTWESLRISSSSPSANTDVYLITDPDIVGVVTRTVTVAE